MDTVICKVLSAHLFKIVYCVRHKIMLQNQLNKNKEELASKKMYLESLFFRLRSQRSKTNRYYNIRK